MRMPFQASLAACTTAAVLLGLSLLPATSLADSLDCPRFAEPQSVKLEWVAPYMIYNGVPMSVKRFDSDQKPEAILDFYRQAWRATASVPAPKEYPVGPWQAIATVRGKCFFTVQVQRAGNGSTGLLSATQTPDKPVLQSSDSKLPMLSGSVVLNDIQHRDEGKNARTLLLSNGFSAQANVDFYRRQLGDQGWATVSSFQMTTKKGPGITLVMKRGLAEASLVFTREGDRTMVLANLVDRP